MAFLIWLESTSISVWVREAPTLWAFPFILFLHTLGLGILVGLSVAMNLAVLGFAPGVRAAPMRLFYPVMWLGFWINAVSGFLLLLAYPAKALTNPVFYAKLILIFWAVINLQWLYTELFVSSAQKYLEDASLRVRRVAMLTLALWFGSIFAGRFLAYTHNVLMASELSF